MLGTGLCGLDAGVAFCDSLGLNTLLRARIDAERQDTAVHPARQNASAVVPHARAG